ncbi:MAG: DUF3795 domain-containing protein [Candidatus Hodarchaeota archaeon]
MAKVYDAYCGLYCGACFVMRANESGNVEKLAEEWNIKLEDVLCDGCKTQVRFINCRSCEIRACAETKGISFCFECQEYPCKSFSNFPTERLPHLVSMPENLEYIKKNGLNNWLETQEQRWKCPQCGEKFSWYETTCEKCGNTLNSYPKPRKPPEKQRI